MRVILRQKPVTVARDKAKSEICGGFISLLSHSALTTALLLASLSVAAPSLKASGPGKTPAALEGTLISIPGKGPFLKTSSKEYALAGTNHYIFHTLMDTRLTNREVRVEGEFKPDGTFEVEWLYTIKDGKLYRVRYFCKVCNIAALQPGNCVCCQQPTELQEIPVTKN